MKDTKVGALTYTQPNRLETSMEDTRDTCIEMQTNSLAVDTNSAAVDTNSTTVGKGSTAVDTNSTAGDTNSTVADEAARQWVLTAVH